MKMFKRNQSGNPVFWEAIINEENFSITVNHGLVGGTINTNEVLPTKPNLKSLMTKYNRIISDKRKIGYKEFTEIYDNTPDIESLNDDMLKRYLNTYLPDINTDDAGNNLVMLAKTFVEDKISYPRIAQPKINGFRGKLKPVKISKGLFGYEYGIEFYSREGNRFSVPNMEKAIADKLGETTIQLMIDQGFELDGELYVPFATVAEIKSYVADDSPKLQYWVYDLIVECLKQSQRLADLRQMLDYLSLEHNELRSLHQRDRNQSPRTLYVIPHKYIQSDKEALIARNAYISIGFEGVILRDPDAEYQHGKRNSAMYKYKIIHDGYFKVLDIVPEGDARPDLPKFVCQNDINEATFEVTIYGSFSEQAKYLRDKEHYIGKDLLVEYRERTTSKNDVPFHAKAVKFK